jgi:hypothetical protein
MTPLMLFFQLLNDNATGYGIRERSHIYRRSYAVSAL